MKSAGNFLQGDIPVSDRVKTLDFVMIWQSGSAFGGSFLALSFCFLSLFYGLIDAISALVPKILMARLML